MTVTPKGGTPGRRSHVEHDTLGRLITARDPDSGERRSTYDDAGRLIHTRNGAGDEVTLSYEGAGRLVSRSGGATTYRYHYDVPEDGTSGARVAGRLAWAEGPVDRSHLTYDLFGNVSRRARTVRGLMAEVTYGHAPSGLRLRETHDDRFTLAYRYDGGGRLVDAGGLWSELELDAGGAVLAERHQNGVTTRNVLDPNRQKAEVTITRATGASLYDVAVTRTPFGSVATVDDRDGVGLAHDAHFAYDGAARLTHAELGRAPAARTLSYAYDGLQNMISRTSAGPEPLGVLRGALAHGSLSGSGPRQLAGIRDPQTAEVERLFDYDAAGRTVRSFDKALTYDAFDRLVTVTSPDPVRIHHRAEAARRRSAAAVARRG